jgi:hypothetical protein
MLIPARTYHTILSQALFALAAKLLPSPALRLQELPQVLRIGWIHLPNRVQPLPANSLHLQLVTDIRARGERVQFIVTSFVRGGCFRAIKVAKKTDIILMRRGPYDIAIFDKIACS